MASLFSVETVLEFLVVAHACAAYAFARMPRSLRVATDAVMFLGILTGTLVFVCIALAGLLGPDVDITAFGVSLLALLVLVILPAGAAMAAGCAMKRREERAAVAPSIPAARAVTLPVREPDTAGVWCPACAAPHATSHCDRIVNACPECGALDGCGTAGPHHAEHCSGFLTADERQLADALFAVTNTSERVP